MTQKILLKSVSLSTIGLAALVGCGQQAQPAISSPTMSAPVTTTAAPTSSTTTTTTMTTTTTTTPPVTAESSYSATAIRSIAVETTMPGWSSGRRVGPELYEISRNGSASINIRWAARGENGDVKSRDCMVVVDTTGPGGLDERRRSDTCTGTTSDEIKVRAPGAYNVTVAITPPDGGAPITGTHTFEVILKGT